MPVFLLGSLAPSIRRELHFDAGHLGMVVSTFWISMAFGGFIAGRLAQTLGATRTTYLGLSTSMVAMLGLALSPLWLLLLIFSALAGIGCAITLPAGDMALFNSLPPNRRGFAFGVKQASLPAASMLAGAFVPLLMLTVGWRWAFISGSFVALSGALSMPRYPNENSKRRKGIHHDTGFSNSRRLGDVVPVAIGVGLAMCGVSAMGAFFVESAINSGNSPRLAGSLLALGGFFGIAGRFLVSWRLDHLPWPYAVVAGLISLGGVGAAVFALHAHGLVLIAGTAIAFGAGWGWNGLMTQTVVTSHPESPARASAYIMVGAASGGAIGPTLFGVMVGHFGYSVAWTVCAAQFFTAAAMFLFVSSQKTKDSGKTAIA